MLLQEEAEAQVTTLDIDAIAARCAAATPGPWVNADRSPLGRMFADPSRRSVVESEAGPANAPLVNHDVEFLIHARVDVPALCQRVRQLEAEKAASDDALAIALGDRSNESRRAIVAESRLAEVVGLLREARKWIYAGDHAYREVFDEAKNLRISIDAVLNVQAGSDEPGGEG